MCHRTYNSGVAHAALEPPPRKEKSSRLPAETSGSRTPSSRIARNTWPVPGCGKAGRIALHMPYSVDLATCYYACLASGCVAVPVNTRLKPEEIAYVLDHSGASAYLAEPDLRIPTLIPSLEPDSVAAAQRSLPLVAADDPALLLYTRGTTARTKG